MRNLPTEALAKIAATHGTEPIFIIGIVWDRVNTSYYCDKDISDQIQGNILDVSTLDAIIQISEGAGDSPALSVTLDDTSGEIKEIINNNDIHKIDAFVYQTFQGLGFDNKFLLYKGEINSPITWKEGDRTVSFDIVGKLEDREVGFSPEEGIFPDIPDNLLGEVWPSLFGTVLNSRTVPIAQSVTGTLAEGTGIHDFTLIHQISAVGSKVAAANYLAAVLLSYYLATGEQKYLDLANQYLFAAGELGQEVAALQDARLQQLDYETSPIRIINGRKFPQGKTISLEIDGAIFTGKFDGDLFNISSRDHPEEKFYTLTDPSIAVEDRKVLPFVDIGLVSGRSPNPSDLELVRQTFIFSGPIVGDQAGFFWANAGSQVSIAGQEDIDYIVSIVPGTVINVSAYRDLEGIKQLIAVPPTYYTVKTKNFNTVDAVIVTLHGTLSSRDGEGWSDDVRVTFKSDVGPNTVDILEYLIDRYSDLTVDSTSFNDVRTKLTNYPMNFGIYERKNIIQQLQEIAFQARCALFIRNDIFYIKYLSEEPTSNATITETDILQNTFELFFTDTEDLVTKLIAQWKQDDAQEKPFNVPYRHNVKKYGLIERTIDFYCYNSLPLVRKSATFWLIRWANTWKKVRFTTALNLLNLETFDTALLDFNTNYVANADVKGYIESATYNSQDHGIDFEMWLPVKSGTMEPYIFAWPANVEEGAIFPTTQEREQGFAGSGEGPSFTAYQAQELIMVNFVEGESGDTYNEINARQDHGDLRPSDVNDVPVNPPVVANNVLDGDPQLVTPKFRQTTPEGNGDDIVINIRKTKIFDPNTDETSILADVFYEIDGVIKMKKDATYSDGGDDGPIDIKYDSETSKYKANEGFLGD